MSKRTPAGNQVDTIVRSSTFNTMTFDLIKQDQFVTSLAVDFTHWKAMPSPIGKNDRGSYRRNDGVDTITSNGLIYKCAGTFSATMVDNSRDEKRSETGLMDPSQSRLILPRFYNKTGLADGERIYMAPGDRVYISDPDANVKVANYEEMDYEPNKDNVPTFPIVKMESTLIDSKNIEYTCDVDYKITSDGNIRWIPGGKNPGIDPDTGKGRIYSIRYLYNAYWYIVSLPKEVRVTNVTNGTTRAPERMAYHAVVMREFIFHNQNRGSQQNQLVTPLPQRVGKSINEPSIPAPFQVPVDMSDILEEDGIE